MKTLLIGIVTIAVYFAIMVNSETKAASGECLLRDCSAEKTTEPITQKVETCKSLQSATEELIEKVKQIQYIDLDEIDSQRMIKFVQKYHKTDLVADSVRVFSSSRYATALVGFSFEDCAAFQMQMNPNKINQITRGERK